MIHTASLVHDDVVDDCNTRRGNSAFVGVLCTALTALFVSFHITSVSIIWLSHCTYAAVEHLSMHLYILLV